MYVELSGRAAELASDAGVAELATSLTMRAALPLRRNGPGYAVLNDISQDFSALHYYIWRAQERQLAEYGFELLECLNLGGRRVQSDQDAPNCSELHYVARRRPAVGERV